MLQLVYTALIIHTSLYWHTQSHVHSILIDQYSRCIHTLTYTITILYYR